MHLDALLWLFLPVFVAGGSALLSFYIMQAKMEVAVSKERETLAEAQRRQRRTGRSRCSSRSSPRPRSDRPDTWRWGCRWRSGPDGRHRRSRVQQTRGNHGSEATQKRSAIQAFHCSPPPRSSRAAICATCWPWNLAASNSFALGCREPLGPARVAAP